MATRKRHLYPVSGLGPRVIAGSVFGPCPVPSLQVILREIQDVSSQDTGLGFGVWVFRFYTYIYICMYNIHTYTYIYIYECVEPLSRPMNPEEFPANPVLPGHRQASRSRTVQCAHFFGAPWRNFCHSQKISEPYCGSGFRVCGFKLWMVLGFGFKVSEP